jgi:hypothetical protein
MKTKISILFLLLFLIDVSLAMADCLACWELRKVEVSLKSGQRMVGFVHWNESWLYVIPNWKKFENKFPENFLEYVRNKPQKQMLLLTKLTTIKNDSLFEFKAITPNDEIFIKTDDVKSIVELEKDAPKYQGAGSLPKYSQEVINMLKTNPYATYHKDIGVADFYYLSYHLAVNRRRLKEISEENNDNEERLAKLGVILVAMSYD